MFINRKNMKINPLIKTFASHSIGNVNLVNETMDIVGSLPNVIQQNWDKDTLNRWINKGCDWNKLSDRIYYGYHDENGNTLENNYYDYVKVIQIIEKLK